MKKSTFFSFILTALSCSVSISIMVHRYHIDNQVKETVLQNLGNRWYFSTIKSKIIDKQ
jgi:hypothetical protein